MIKTKTLLILLIFISFDFINAQTTAGKDWIKASDSASFSPRSSHQILFFKNKLWLIGTIDIEGKSTNDTWYSDDAINWKQGSGNTGFSGGTAVVFNDKLWMINTEGKNVWNSEDGLNWKKITTLDRAAQYGTNAVVYKNKIWITGGADVIDAYLPDGKLNPNRKIIWKNDVWSSTDGIDWTKQITDSCFSNRSDHSFLVFKDKMWIIAGQSGPNKNDAWSSSDGIKWTLVGNAPFRARHVSQVVEFQNKLWIIGGFAFDNTGYPILLSDVWSSSDGKNWDEVTSSSAFGRRMEHKAIVFKNRIWVIGGQTGTFENHYPLNDIWYYELNPKIK